MSASKLSLLGLVSCGLVSCGLFALTPARVRADESVELYVRGPASFDGSALALQLARDLGVDVLVEPGVDESDATPIARVIVERAEGDTLRIFVQRPSGHTMVRRVADDTPPDALALLISNLVRDESAELLELLRVEPGEVTPELDEPAASPDDAAGPPPPDDNPEIGREASREPPAAAEPGVSFGLDFVPGLGFSTATLGRDRRAVSLGVLGAWSGALSGASLSSLVDVVERRSDGAQLSGLVSVTGGALDGLQLSGLLSVVGQDVYGAQLAGLVSLGAQDVNGVQMSALLNVAGQRANGVQLGLTNIAGARASGGQIGLVNIAGGDVDGAQIGLVNIAGGRVHGVQLGLVNVSERADAPIGLASVQHGGESEFRLSFDTGGFLSATLVHGSGVFRTLVAATVEPFLSRVLGGPGLGLGLRADPTEGITLDFEALAYALFGDRIEQLGVDLLTDVRAVVTIELVEHVALHISLGARLHVTDAPEPELGAPFLETDFGRGEPGVRLWPTIGAGISLY